MATPRPAIQQSINSTNVADLLERILDKGIVISGDIKVKLVDVELLTIQIRLVICSVDKAKEIGIDWWNENKVTPRATQITTTAQENPLLPSIQALNERVAQLEALLAKNG